MGYRVDIVSTLLLPVALPRPTTCPGIRGAVHVGPPVRGYYAASGTNASGPDGGAFVGVFWKQGTLWIDWYGAGQRRREKTRAQSKSEAKKLLMRVRAKTVARNLGLFDPKLKCTAPAVRYLEALNSPRAHHAWRPAFVALRNFFLRARRWLSLSMAERSGTAGLPPSHSRGLLRPSTQVQPQLALCSTSRSRPSASTGRRRSTGTRE